MTPELNNFLFVVILGIMSLSGYLWIISLRIQRIRKSVFKKNHHNSVIPPSEELRADDNSNDLFLFKIHYLLEKNIEDPQFGISQLCNSMGLSRAQIYRKFKAMNGRTLHDYLRFYRLNRAKELLHTTSLNVSEVAYVTGFINVSHFSRIFKEEFGKNPRDCRKELILFT